jgi:hypothetical protein
VLSGNGFGDGSGFGVNDGFGSAGVVVWGALMICHGAPAGTLGGIARGGGIGVGGEVGNNSAMIQSWAWLGDPHAGLQDLTVFCVGDVRLMACFWRCSSVLTRTLPTSSALPDGLSRLSRLVGS